MAGVVSRASAAGLRGVTTPRTASRTRRVVVSSSARRDVPCAVGKKASHRASPRPLAVSWTAPRATSRRDRRFAKTRASVDDDDAKEDADKRPASEKRPASGDVRPESGDKKPPEPSPNDDETDSDANLLELLNLLVLTGGVKGSLAVVLGYFAGINALGLIHPDLVSTAHGFAFAAPVLFLDALVMVPRWDVSDAQEDAIERGEVPLGKIEKIQRALSKYQRDEALSNPCRSMPAYQDAIVAATARFQAAYFSSRWVSSNDGSKRRSRDQVFAKPARSG